MDWQEYAARLRHGEFQPTFASSQEQGYVVTEARNAPMIEHDVWPYWQAHACPPYPSSAPQTSDQKALDPFSAQSIRFAQHINLPYLPLTVHNGPALPIEQSLPYQTAPPVQQKQPKRTRENQHPPRSYAREAPIHHRIAKVRYPELSQPPSRPKLRRGQFPPRDSTPPSTLEYANDAHRQFRQHSPIQAKDIRSYQEERQYKRLKLEQRAPTADRVDKRSRQNDASIYQAKTKDAAQPSNIDARRVQHVETIQSMSHASSDTKSEQWPLVQHGNASHCEETKASTSATHTADCNSLSHTAEDSLSSSVPERPDTAAKPTLDLHDIYEIVIQSTYQLLASAGADTDDGTIQEGFTEIVEDAPSKQVTLSPLPSSLGELINAPFGERPSYTWWELARPIIVELKRLTGRPSFAISEIVDVLQTKFLYFADPQILDWTKKILSQTLRHAKGVTQHIHYEGNARRATWGCDESVDPRVRRATVRTKDATEAAEDKEEEVVDESGPPKVTAAAESNSEKMLAVVSKASEKTEVTAQVPSQVEVVTHQAPDEPVVRKQAELQQAREHQTAVSDKGKKVGKERKEKKEKKAKGKEGRNGKPQHQRIADLKSNANHRKVETKAEAKHTEPASVCHDCEWCGEGSK